MKSSLGLFLIFAKNPGWGSYKLGSFKKKSVQYAFPYVFTQKCYVQQLRKELVNTGSSGLIVSKTEGPRVTGIQTIGMTPGVRVSSNQEFSRAILMHFVVLCRFCDGVFKQNSKILCISQNLFLSMNEAFFHSAFYAFRKIWLDRISFIL